MRVLLALPTGGQPTAPFLASLRELRMPPSVTAFDRLAVSGNFIPGQRELAARRALALDADVLVMIDDDMIVPPEALERIVEALTADPRLAVVGALYYSRDGIRPIAADRWTSRDTTTAAIPAFADALTYCDAVGFGCAAIRVGALRTLAAPFFNTQVYVEENASTVRICNEDFLFCEDVRRAGWTVALHAGIRCKHYDRRAGVAYPLAWEATAETACERMIVARPGPQFALVPYDAAQPAKGERHEHATIDYIIVD